MKKYLRIPDVVSAILLGLLLYTGIGKLQQHNDFLLALAASPLLRPHAGWLSWCIPFTEIIIAALLFFPATRQKGLYSSALLLTAFTGYLAWMLLQQAPLPCSCGGFINNLSWPQHFLFNAVLLAITVTGILLNKRKDKRKERPPTCHSHHNW